MRNKSSYDIHEGLGARSVILIQNGRRMIYIENDL